MASTLKRTATAASDTERSDTETSGANQLVSKRPCTRLSTRCMKTCTADDVRILVTGTQLDKHWIECLESFGAVLIDDISEAHTATHVIASDDQRPMRRTPKLMIALSCNTTNIVSLQWLKASHDARALLSCVNFLVLDKDAEKMYSFSMKKTMGIIESRLKNEGPRLLEGWSVYICRGVAGNRAPDAKELKLMIEAAGGSWLKSCSNKVLNFSKLLIITSDPEPSKQVSMKAEFSALENGAEKRTTTWLFDAMLKQECDLETDADCARCSKLTLLEVKQTVATAEDADDVSDDGELAHRAGSKDNEEQEGVESLAGAETQQHGEQVAYEQQKQEVTEKELKLLAQVADEQKKREKAEQEAKRLREQNADEHKKREEAETGVRHEDKPLILIPPSNNHQQRCIVEELAKFLDLPGTEALFSKWAVEDLENGRIGCREINQKRFELFLLDDNKLPAYVTASHLNGSQDWSRFVTESFSKLAASFIEHLQIPEMKTMQDVCQAILGKTIRQIESVKELKGRYVYSAPGIISSFGSSDEQVLHLDILKPNRLCLTYLTDKSAPTVVVQRKPGVAPVTKPGQLVQIWKTLVPSSHEAEVQEVINVLEDNTLEASRCRSDLAVYGDVHLLPRSFDVIHWNDSHVHEASLQEVWGDAEKNLVSGGTSLVMQGGMHYAPGAEISRHTFIIAMCPTKGQFEPYSGDIQWNGSSLSAQHLLRTYHLLSRKQRECLMWIVANDAEKRKCYDLATTFTNPKYENEKLTAFHKFIRSKELSRYIVKCNEENRNQLFLLIKSVAENNN